MKILLDSALVMQGVWWPKRQYDVKLRKKACFSSGRAGEDSSRFGIDDVGALVAKTTILCYTM